MAEKITFQKLTEDLDKLNNDELEKSEDKKQEDATNQVTPQVQPDAEFVQPEAAETIKEEAEKKDEEKVEEPEAEVKAEEGKGEEVEPEVKPEAEEDEEVEKSSKKKEDAEKAAGEEQKPKTGKDAKEAKDKKKKDEKVEKSESSDEGISDQDFIGAFEAVVKSYSTIKNDQVAISTKVDAIEKSLSEILSLLKTEEVTKSEGEEKKEDKEKDEKPADEALEAEDIEKSVKVEEELEGKAVESISKSTDGVAVPEASTEEVQVEEEEPVFNAAEHVKTVTDFYTHSAGKLSLGERTDVRHAVQRVKRNQATEADVALFEKIVNLSKN